MEKTRVSKCENCLYYDYDEYYEMYKCRQNLDEDENVRFMGQKNNDCPYFKFYDEYKSVQHQN